MKFITIEDERINIDMILRYYHQDSSLGSRLVVEFTNETVRYFYKTTVEEVDRLINPPTTPRPRGLR